jgi:hypothetical protein
MTNYPRSATILGIAVCCLNLCAWPLVAAFLKNPEWRAPYLVSVSVLSTLFLLVLEHRARLSLTGLLVCAGLGGEVCGVIALQIAKLFDRIDGLAAFTKQSAPEMLSSIFTMDALVAALLGGWLTTLLAALIVRAWSSKSTRRSA